MPKISAKVRERLTKLADYLETLSVGYRHFEMESFFENKPEDEGCKLEAKYARENGGVPSCGTTACAIGHGPSAGVLMTGKYITSYVDSWNGKRVFEVDWDGYTQLFIGGATDWTNPDGRLLFNWMFGGWWSDRDNHHWGAAARIRYVLAGREIPEEFVNSCFKPMPRHVALYREFHKRFRTS